MMLAGLIWLATGATVDEDFLHFLEASPAPLPTAISDSTEGELAFPSIKTEPWEVEVVAGLRLCEWYLFDFRKSIEGPSGQVWKPRVDDLVGGTAHVALHVKNCWIEKYFEYTFAVLDTVDRMSVRTLGFNIGYDIPVNHHERLTLIHGWAVVYPDLEDEEGGQDLPGEMRRTWATQVGARYVATLNAPHSHGPFLSFSAEAALRYVPFRFEGDAGVSDETISSFGLVLQLGLNLNF